MGHIDGGILITLEYCMTMTKLCGVGISTIGVGRRRNELCLQVQSYRILQSIMTIYVTIDINLAVRFIRQPRGHFQYGTRFFLAAAVLGEPAFAAPKQ